jgi:DNA-binding LacI/PurR family transcriptional regulator
MKRIERLAAMGIVGMAVFTAFAEDAYVESDGTQAVNTGYFANPGTKVVIDYTLLDVTTVQQRLFGSNRGLIFQHYVNGSKGLSFALQDGTGDWTAFSPQYMAAEDRHVFTLDAATKTASIVKDGAQVATRTTSAQVTQASDFPLTLLADGNNALGTAFSDQKAKARLYSCQIYDHDELVRASLLALQRYMPVVLIGCVPPWYGFPAVTNDNAAMLRQVVAYLNGMGHERIAFIGGVQEDTDPRRRDVGYEEGLQDARLPYTASYRVYGKGTAEAGKAALDEMLGGLKREYWPTAVIGLNDLVAMGCMAAARDRNLSVPDQLSVIGCDNLFCAPYLTPPLTSINTHQQQTGAQAVRLLLSGENRKETADWELVERASCAPAK